MSGRIPPNVFFMVSPQEPDYLRALGTVHALPEKYGSDFMWAAQGGMWGIQRKEFPNDFLASRSHMEKHTREGPDGNKIVTNQPEDRLARELQQMQALQERILLLEGFGHWLPNGFLSSDFRQYHIAQLTEFLLSIQVRREFDVTWLWVPGPEHTQATIEYLVRWSLNRDPQSSLIRRVKPRWGTRDSRDYKRHILMGVEGLGPTLADAILDHLDGQLPFRLTPGLQLTQIPGIGPGMAKRILELFPEDGSECQNKPKTPKPRTPRTVKNTKPRIRAKSTSSPAASGESPSPPSSAPASTGG